MPLSTCPAGTDTRSWCPGLRAYVKTDTVLPRGGRDICATSLEDIVVRAVKGKINDSYSEPRKPTPRNSPHRAVHTQHGSKQDVLSHCDSIQKGKKSHMDFSLRHTHLFNNSTSLKWNTIQHFYKAPRVKLGRWFSKALSLCFWTHVEISCGWIRSYNSSIRTAPWEAGTKGSLGAWEIDNLRELTRDSLYEGRR